MERSQNINNGQQALGQIPATTATSDVPKLPSDVLPGGTSHFVDVPPITVQMPNGSVRTVEFRTLLKKRVVDALLLKTNYNSEEDRRQRFNPGNDPKLKNLPVGLFTAAPVATEQGLVDPSILYKVAVTHPVELGTVLAELGL
ncbi:MAG: hypothetical protein LBC30_00565 [Puniceicoccales bacterium]|jgi:hypothetical protein|nr:hypothetical protein [Puniceicoccales bacterium]